MPSKRTLEWREKNKNAVDQWRKKMEELRNLSAAENWHYERMEMEVAKRKFGWDNWVKDLDQQRNEKVSYDLDKIISQLEKGDYSSLDPEIRKEIEEKEKEEKRKKVAQPKRKEITP